MMRGASIPPLSATRLDGLRSTGISRRDYLRCIALHGEVEFLSDAARRALVGLRIPTRTRDRTNWAEGSRRVPTGRCAHHGSWRIKERSGVWGEVARRQLTSLMAASARSSMAWSRDVAKMPGDGIPVFAGGTCIYDSAHHQRVIRRCPSRSAGVRFCSRRPGDCRRRRHRRRAAEDVRAEPRRAAWEGSRRGANAGRRIKAGMKAQEA